MELGSLVQHPAGAHLQKWLCSTSLVALRTQELSKAIQAFGGPGLGPGRHWAPLFPPPTPLPLSGRGKGSSITTLFLFFHPCCDRICPERSVPGQLSGPILMKVTECPGS